MAIFDIAKVPLPYVIGGVVGFLWNHALVEGYINSAPLWLIIVCAMASLAIGFAWFAILRWNFSKIDKADRRKDRRDLIEKLRIITYHFGKNGITKDAREFLTEEQPIRNFIPYCSKSFRMKYKD
ncbi:MAG: hypothetical protein EOP04_30005 [Proteobacteria bacterium]|nr:MAG: hypothetical protein EOP04_30005 [Pseudomonadota bacterium]